MFNWHSSRRFLRPCVFLPPRASFISSCLFQARCFNRSHIPPSLNEKNMASAPLCSCSGARQPRTNPRSSPIRKTQKTPRRTCSGSPSTNFGLLGGPSAVPDRLLSRVCARVRFETRLSTSRSEQPNSTIGKPARGCQPTRGPVLNRRDRAPVTPCW